jgi:hypothetical protein
MINTTPETICLRAFLAVLSERSTAAYLYNDTLTETECKEGLASARKGIILGRYHDLMAKVIQDMGYSGEMGYNILLNFKKAR